MDHQGYTWAEVAELTADAQALLAVVTRMVEVHAQLDAARLKWKGDVASQEHDARTYRHAMEDAEMALKRVLLVKQRLRSRLPGNAWNAGTHCTICGLPLKGEYSETIMVPQAGHLPDLEHHICENCLRDAGVE